MPIDKSSSTIIARSTSIENQCTNIIANPSVTHLMTNTLPSSNSTDWHPQPSMYVRRLLAHRQYRLA
uniref:Glutamate decarboxylase n=1 Tax=Lactiplantibacillus plantarum TaxID=1590 RepID=A0A0C6EX45_LACPN|nr:glutamate decarboxylase [Lactiplantibacillus plantarum]